MKKLYFSFTESDTRILLESLKGREREMAKICEESDDDDLIADTGNDLIEVRLLINSVQEKAIQLFGMEVINFERRLL